MTKFAQHCGVARYAYNWGLDVIFNCLEARNLAKDKGEALPKFPTSIDLHKKLNAEVKTQHPWFYDSSKCAPQQALRDLENAWKRKMKVKGSGTPKRKKKFVRDSFYLEGSIQIKDGFIKLPKIGFVRLHESVTNQTIKNVRISRKADKWFVSFKVEVNIELAARLPGGSLQEVLQQAPPTVKCFDKVGVDLGIKTLATLSDGAPSFPGVELQEALRGAVFPALKPYRTNKAKLAKLQRKASKQVKGSKNRAKTQQKIARLHARIANIRNDATHKLTSHLTKNHSEIVIEDLNVSGMMKNHKLASEDC